MSSSKSQADAPKTFSYVINVAEIPDGGLDLDITADPETLSALAAADGLKSIARLEAEFHVARKSEDRVNVSGEMRAKITQICVVSLEPFESEVVEPIDVDFAPSEIAAELAARAAAPGHEAHELDEEPPDPIVDGKIDLGALAAEFLALGIDPYPRKPGVTFEPPPEGEAERQTPFSILRKLKERS
jgi:uncharacterized metal-binding protein YceD (DUF177 family)